jgi:hypothetical protein
MPEQHPGPYLSIPSVAIGSVVFPGGHPDDSDCGDPFCRESSTFPIQPGGEEPVSTRALARFPRAGSKGSCMMTCCFLPTSYKVLSASLR